MRFASIKLYPDSRGGKLRRIYVKSYSIKQPIFHEDVHVYLYYILVVRKSGLKEMRKIPKQHLN